MISEVSPNSSVVPCGYSLSNALPTVGFEPQPEVVSDSPHLVDTHSSLSGACFALQLGRPLHVFLGHLGGVHDGFVIAVLLDAEAGDRLAGRGDAVDDFLRPAVLDADDDDRGDVGIGAGADQGAEMQFEVFAELQAAIGVGQRHRVGNIVGHGLAGGVGQVVDRQDDDVVAHADAAVFAAIAAKGRAA